MVDVNTRVLMPIEAETIVENLKKFDLIRIGNTEWSRQHEVVEKLNIQAVVNASAQEDEFIKDFLISYEKMPVLVHDLLLTEVWREKIFQELIDLDFEPKTTFPIYIILYHEATVVNLLETVLFFRESMEASEDQVLDIVDYCYRNITDLIASKKVDEEEEVTPDSSATTIEELEDQAKKLNFDICVKCVSLLRYVTDHLDSLPLSVLNRLLDTHDLPVLMVELVENPPWSRRRNGEVSKYIDSKWQEVSMEDSLKVTKTEGQVWICLYHLLMEQACQQKYDLNPYRKNTVLKLRSYLTEVLLDQIPVLGEMQRYLEHLSMMDPPPAKKDLILEQVPEIRNEILRQYSGKWTKIAKKQMKTVFSQSSAAMRDQAKRWADTYNFDVLEGLLTDPPKCALCGDQATKRCSRCQNEWYCRRECQVKHWSKHKKACDLLHNTLDELKAKEQNGKAS